MEAHEAGTSHSCGDLVPCSAWVVLIKTVSMKDTNSSSSSSPSSFFFFFPPFFLGLVLKEMERHEEERLCGKWRVACGLYSYNLRDVFTW